MDLNLTKGVVVRRSKYSRRRAKRAWITHKALLSPNVEQDGVAAAIQEHFSGGVLCRKENGIWQIAAITDMRWPDEVRIPGGTSHAGETSVRTLSWELLEELGIVIDESSCRHVHTRIAREFPMYFFTVSRWQGDCRSEAFADGKETIRAHWVSLRDFRERCFKNHRKAFRKAIAKIAEDMRSSDPDFMEQAIAAGIIYVGQIP